jgi:hypothetical protein
LDNAALIYTLGTPSSLRFLAGREMTAGLRPRTISSGTRTTEHLRTWVNGVTLFRTVAGLALFSAAASQGSPTWNLAGLVTSWGLDVVDGFLASGEVQTVPSPDPLSIRLRRWARSFGARWVLCRLLRFLLAGFLVLLAGLALGNLARYLMDSVDPSP